jgi:hypothetical protein
MLRQMMLRDAEGEKLQQKSREVPSVGPPGELKEEKLKEENPKEEKGEKPKEEKPKGNIKK